MKPIYSGWKLGSGKPSWIIVLRWALGLGIASLAIGILARGLDWETLVVALKEAAYEWIVVGVVVISATVITRASRWRMLLYEEGVDLWSAVSAILIGQVISVGLPVARSGDVARAVWIGRRENSPGVVHTLGSIVIEKIYDLMALCATGLLLLVIIPLPSWFVKSTWGLVLVIVAGVPALYFSIRWQTSLLALSGRFLSRFPEKVGRLVMPQLRQLMEALGKTRHPRASIGAALWTLVTWLLGGLANWLVMRAFGVPSIPAAIFLLATLMLGSSAVPTPGRLGIFEGITVVSLAQFGVDPGPALAIGLVLHLVVMGPPLVMAALLMGAHALGWLPNPAAPVKVDPPLQCSADLPG